MFKQFTDDSNTGQVLDEAAIVSLLGQYPAVSPALARDYRAVGNATTVHSGLTAQIHVTADCAIVGVGRIPNTHGRRASEGRSNMKLKRTIFPAISLVAILALAACGGSSTSTIHGQVTPNGPSSALGLGGDQQTYTECVNDTPKPGDQITVTDASGKVIGNATLGLWSHAKTSAGGLTLFTCAEPFTMTSVPSESRYGFQISGISGTTWITDITHTVSLAVTGG